MRNWYVRSFFGTYVNLNPVGGYATTSNDGNPGNNWGVDCCSGSAACPTFDFTLTYCPGNSAGTFNGTIVFQTSADGESGGWCQGGNCDVANTLNVQINGVCAVESGTATTIPAVCNSTGTPIVDLFTLLNGESPIGTWTASGSNPSGGTFNASAGTFNPVGATAGNYTFTYQAGVAGCMDSPVNVTLTIQNCVVCVPPTSLTTPNACVGGGTVTFTQTGGTAGGTWTISGGGTVVASTGIFTPSTPGCYTATYTVGVTCTLSRSFLVYPAEPTISPPANTCNAAFTLPSVTVVSGFTTQFSIDGGAWASSPSIPTTPGCHTIQARYVNTAACGSTAANTVSASAACDVSNTVSVLIYPAEPMISPPANTCNAAFTLPSVTVVSGFTTQFSIDGGAWASSPSIPTTPGCHTIQARYVNTAACGSTAANTVSASAACDVSNTVSVLIYPAEPTISPPANICNAAFTLPSVTVVSGFTTQFSIDGGAWASSPSIPTTPGCHTIQARYVNTAACGSTAANTASASAACDVSNTVNIVIFPPAPSTPVVANQCGGTLTIPIPTTYAGFTPQYSFDNGSTWGTTNTTSVTGCYNLMIRYVLTAACGSTPANTSIACASSAADPACINVPVTPTFSPIAAICSGGSITLPTSSTNSINGSWSPAVNNTATTTYTFTPSAGQCATTATLTVTVNAPVTPTFSPIAAICSGGSITLPATSTNSIGVAGVLR
ncbi:MAG: hypothetical protein IPL35_00260 [Sphingobacteriales bacterium]|nr:hypothetical protein [Sphingobacteriales bacterium]